ncbi:MAG: DMT family transporter [Proteobacteria bacterium]|nr:DMT family transporter [Pseudomonadota bacterium]
MTSKHLISVFSLLIITAGWGLTFPLIKDSIATIRPFTFIAIRFVFALSTLLLGGVLFRVFRPKSPAKGLREWMAGGLLGLFLFGTYSLQTIGMQYTSSSSAGFLTGLSVVMVPVILLFTGGRIGLFSLIGIALSVVGAAMLSLSEGLQLNRGDALVIGCAFMVALHIVFVGRFTRRYDAFRLTLIQILVCLVLCSSCAGILESADFALASMLPKAWGAMAFCGIIATAIAYLVQMVAQAHVSPVKTSLILTLEPVFGAIFSVWLLHDQLRSIQWAGGAVMVMAMLVAELGPLVFQSKTAQLERDSP